jgi:hypothetical protein
VPETLELEVGARLGGYARRAVNVREAVGQPCLRGLALGKGRDIEDLQTEVGRQSLATACDCLPYKDCSLDAKQLLQTGEPQEPISFARLTPPALAFERRARQTQPAVDVQGKHIKIGQNIAAGFRIHVNRNTEACEGPFGELQPGDPTFKICAIVADVGVRFRPALAR